MFSTTQMTECHVFHLWSECYVPHYLVVRETYLQFVRVTWKHVTEICLPSASRLYAQLGQENPTETDMILLMWQLTTVFRKSNLWSVASSIAQPFFRGHFVLITDSWNPSIKLLKGASCPDFFWPRRWCAAQTTTWTCPQLFFRFFFFVSYFPGNTKNLL